MNGHFLSRRQRCRQERSGWRVDFQDVYRGALGREDAGTSAPAPAGDVHILLGVDRRDGIAAPNLA